jgi:dipeptidyl aminopeptidase/acylaminoacyl peptidase
VRDLQSIDANASWRSSIKMAPDGDKVAYLLQSPNLQTNVNDVQLYVRTLSESSAPSSLVLAGDITDFSWYENGRRLAVLVRENGRRVIESIDLATKGKTLLVRADVDISEFSIDERGDTVAFAVRDNPLLATEGDTSEQGVARGFRIPFERNDDAQDMHSTVFVTKSNGGAWTDPQKVQFTSPLGGQKMTQLVMYENNPLMPTLSPDGSKLLVRYSDRSSTMPEEWRNSAHMHFQETYPGAVREFQLIVMYRMATEQTSLPVKAPEVYSAPLWAPDSKSFVVAIAPEIGTAAEKNETVGGMDDAQLVSVEPDASRVSMVSPHVTDALEGPLQVGRDNSVLARVEPDRADVFTRFVRQGGEWKSAGSFEVPLPLHATAVAASDRYVIGSFNDLTVPPELFSYEIKSKDLIVLERLNPQFDHLTLAKPIEVHWQTSEGFNAYGILLLPPGYEQGKRYPLVIHTKPFTNTFVCSFGNFPSFAPQPLANAGIMYLGPGVLRGHKDTGPPQKVADYTPKGYPPGLAEAAFAMDVWDSAVKSLSKQGLVDESKVGIIGFSRTGWHTEFILANSKIRYRAATATDNIQFSLGEYWISHDASTMKEYENAFGGPPYGATLKNWLKYSVSFNLDKFHTPLLMEEMGYGISKTLNPLAPPITLIESYEVFSGLSRLNKPVELYFYPNEDHTPQHPQARLATMQRNVDWYRFWLQGYERPNPEDPDQYKRWEHLRELQNVEDKVVTTNPTSY